MPWNPQLEKWTRYVTGSQWIGRTQVRKLFQIPLNSPSILTSFEVTPQSLATPKVMLEPIFKTSKFLRNLDLQAMMPLVYYHNSIKRVRQRR